MTDQSWLPTGQTDHKRLLVTGEKLPSEALLQDPDLHNWRLVICGDVAHPFELTFQEFMALPQQSKTCDIHCVTTWSAQQQRFEGIPLAQLIERAQPHATARFIRFECYSPRKHDTSVPLELAMSDVWLVHSHNGAPLTLEHGWPLRAITPSRYFYKSPKWVHRIEVLQEDHEGYWERESFYHNNADPWDPNASERYKSVGITNKNDAAQLRKGVRLSKFRKTVIISADLTGWNPKERDLSGLQLKNCVLVGAQLALADLTGCNFTNSNVRGANLHGATIVRADMEGACFIGADLRGADLRGTSLTATVFCEQVEDEWRGAQVEGLIWEDQPGLSQQDRAYLLHHAGPACTTTI